MTSDKKDRTGSWVGDFLVRNLPAIVVGLGAVIGFVWNAASGTADLRNTVDRQKAAVVQLQERVKGLESLSPTVAGHAKDIVTIQRDIVRLQQRVDRQNRWYRHLVPPSITPGGK